AAGRAPGARRAVGLRRVAGDQRDRGPHPGAARGSPRPGGGAALMAGYRRGRRPRAEGAEERKPKPFTPERAWNYLLWLLARRSYTVSELRQRLERRGLPEADAEPLLERLVELRLVD